jgi:hypothetical protein
MTATPAPPSTTVCGLCGLSIAYGQRGNHSLGRHAVHPWRVRWSPPGGYPCTAHEACLLTGFAYGTPQKLNAHISRLERFPVADDPAEPTDKPPRLCTICGRPEKASGLCSGHLSRRERGLENWDGPLAARRAQDIEQTRRIAAYAVLQEHGILATVELPLTVLEALAAVLTDTDKPPHTP